MTRILALWAVPRSTSTAFEWMMRVRGDFTCYHEPFGEVWYQGEEPDWPRLQPDSVRTAGLTYESAWRDLQAAADAGPVFIKEFPLYLERLWTDEFLSHFTHSFLIRHPAKTVTSMFKHWPDFISKETGFVEQRQLFDRLADPTGVAPPVVDSDDLLADPASMVRAWCEAVGIGFLPEALSWDPGAREEVSWWDGGSFHQNLRDSDGLRPQPNTSVDLADAPERVQEVVVDLLPHYEHLYAHRLTVDHQSIGDR
ncbi:MAG: sulfotransferase family protein [Actinomycetia bacterium]|nr:sulfotransferase family protein [Actinomycetes bacterium]